jgi:F-type H+-transporting ATPase subunit epsilon
MAMNIHVDIVSAHEEIFSGTAEVVVVPTMSGEVGIYPRHTPLLAPIKSGEVRLKTGDSEQYFYVSGGILEVQPHVVTVLADTAFRANDLEEAQALAAKESAEKAMKDKKSDVDYARAQAELVEAMAQLKVIDNIRKRAKK